MRMSWFLCFSVNMRFLRDAEADSYACISRKSLMVERGWRERDDLQLKPDNNIQVFNKLINDVLEKMETGSKG